MKIQFLIFNQQYFKLFLGNRDKKEMLSKDSISPQNILKGLKLPMYCISTVVKLLFISRINQNLLKGKC